MKVVHQKNSYLPASLHEVAQLRTRLADAEETLRAIRSGEVDSVMVAGKEGSQVFTLDGAESAYRLLIESMNEGALKLTADKTILYANQCFARMVKCPLEQVTGSSFRRFLSAADRAILRPLMKQAAASGSKIQVLLHAVDGSLVPALLSIGELANEGSNEGFTLKPEDCARLQMEAFQYHHRYICLLQLEEFPGALRDTTRNLKVFDFVEEYAENERDGSPHAVDACREHNRRAIRCPRRPGVSGAVTRGTRRVPISLRRTRRRQTERDSGGDNRPKIAARKGG